MIAELFAVCAARLEIQSIKPIHDNLAKARRTGDRTARGVVFGAVPD